MGTWWACRLRRACDVRDEPERMRGERRMSPESLREDGAPQRSCGELPHIRSGSLRTLSSDHDLICQPAVLRLPFEHCVEDSDAWWRGGGFGGWGACRGIGADGGVVLGGEE